MEQNVGDFAADDLRVFEKVLGHKLQENQRVIIQVYYSGDGYRRIQDQWQWLSESPVRD